MNQCPPPSLNLVYQDCERKTGINLLANITSLRMFKIRGVFKHLCQRFLLEIVMPFNIFVKKVHHRCAIRL